VCDEEALTMKRPRPTRTVWGRGRGEEDEVVEFEARHKLKSLFVFIV
jgi:hypothetical protein